MKTDWTHLDKWRLVNKASNYSSPPGATFGAFRIPHPHKGRFVFNVIAVDGEDTEWEHVSVHVEDINGTKRTPSWSEMDFIKGLFWEDAEVVVQYHINGPTKVDVHPYVLHLWRNSKTAFAQPPEEFV